MASVFTFSGKEIKIGDRAITFKGEKVILKGIKPPKLLVEAEDGHLRSVYPQVVNATLVSSFDELPLRQIYLKPSRAGWFLPKKETIYG